MGDTDVLVYTRSFSDCVHMCFLELEDSSFIVMLTEVELLGSPFRRRGDSGVASLVMTGLHSNWCLLIQLIHSHTNTGTRCKEKQTNKKNAVPWSHGGRSITNLLLESSICSSDNSTKG